ncbi:MULTISPECIES: NAD(P)/FAD-dependent oxidoreductase [unclassified Luteibacter]|uniref:NAD(P)/FAD-dependent oxidoreductase n=1 Tax=Luteibacter sp. PvP019 TaxID=3156436 RepID=UPI00339540C3
MSYDAIVVGGSFAGQAAAIQLARARRRVLVIDAAKPRNRFAKAAHGIVGHDGKSPRAIVQEATRQLLNYPTAAFIDGAVTRARKLDDGFEVTLANGESETGKRLILAGGVTDELPPIEGLWDRWGSTVIHCPYCHGFEVAGRELGVLASSPMSAHQAAMIPEWGPTTYFTQGEYEPDAEQLERFGARGVRIERSPIVGLHGDAPGLTGVLLADGRLIPMGALFVAPKVTPSSLLFEQLGCATDEGPMGIYIRVDDWKQTSVTGVYAAGDVASPMHNASFAIAAGVAAGVGAHQSLMA